MDPDECKVPDEAARGRDGPLEVLTKLASSFASHIAGVQSALQRLVSVQADRAQLAIRRRLQLAIVGALGALATGTLIIAATIALVRGMVQGLTLLCGGREWLGSIAAALLCFGLVGGGAALALQRWNRRQRVKDEGKYARLRRQGQRAEATRSGAPG